MRRKPQNKKIDDAGMVRARKRWDLARLNKKYKKLYHESFPDIPGIVPLQDNGPQDPEIPFLLKMRSGGLEEEDKIAFTKYREEGNLREQVVKIFLKEFYVVPMNPDFTFDEIEKEFSVLDKAVRIEKFSPGYFVICKFNYLYWALAHLSEIHLSSESHGEYSPVIKSYLTCNKNLIPHAAGLGLIDLSLFPGKNSLLKKYEGNVHRITMDIDMSYPQNEIVKYVRRWLTLWENTIEHLADDKETRNPVTQIKSAGAPSSRCLEDLIKVRNLRETKKNGVPMSYTKIAERLGYPNLTSQKIKDICDKANTLIDGGYKEIR